MEIGALEDQGFRILLGEERHQPHGTKENLLLFVRGRRNCAASLLKKFTNICQLSEIISLKLFHKPWNETVHALLRSKGFCYLLVNPNEILLKVNSWNEWWFLLSADGRGRGAEGLGQERQTGS